MGVRVGCARGSVGWAGRSGVERKGAAAMARGGAEQR